MPAPVNTLRANRFMGVSPKDEWCDRAPRWEPPVQSDYIPERPLRLERIGQARAAISASRDRLSPAALDERSDPISRVRGAAGARSAASYVHACFARTWVRRPTLRVNGSNGFIFSTTSGATDAGVAGS